MILFITLAGSVLMVFIVLTCYRVFIILFRKEHDRDVFVTENSTVVSVVRTYTSPRWPTKEPEQEHRKPPPVYRDNDPPPPYALVFKDPGIQESKTGILPSEKLMIQCI